MPCVRLKGQTDVPGLPPPLCSWRTSFPKDFLGDGYRIPGWLVLLRHGYALAHTHAFLSQIRRGLGKAVGHLVSSKHHPSVCWRTLPKGGHLFHAFKEREGRGLPESLGGPSIKLRCL